MPREPRPLATDPDERLTDDEAATILARYQATGDLAHRNRVVEAHLPLARHIGGDYRDRGVDTEDLFQVATIGLVKAAERFDPDRGVPFAAYASQTINGEIKRWFRDKGWAIRPPRRLLELSTAVSRARGRLTQQLQRAPTVAELAADVGITEEEVLDALEATTAYRADSLTGATDDDESAGTDHAAHLGTDDDDLRRAELRNAVGQVLAQLPDDERRIVELRFWDDRTQSDIAEIMNVSQMQISRVLRRVLRKLRSSGGPFDA